MLLDNGGCVRARGVPTRLSVACPRIHVSVYADTSINQVWAR